MKFRLFSLFYFLLTGLLHAQQFPIKRYTNYDGLSQMQVTCLYKDSRGYLWVGTHNGLNKFNGEEFTNYYTEDGLPYEHIKSIAEDPKGYVWVLCERDGLARFDGQRFRKYEKGTGEFSSLTIDDKGNVFCLKDRQLLQIVNDSLVTALLPKELTNKPIDNLFFDRATGSFLLGIKDMGFVQWKARTWHLVTTKPAYRMISLNNFILYQEMQTRNWFVFEKGTFQLLLEMKGITPHILRPLPFSWAFMINGSPYLLEKNSFAPEKVNENGEFIGEGDAVTAQLPDENGIWIGGEKGLNFIATNGIRYFTEKEVPRAWGVTEDAKGRILIQNWLYPLQQWDGKTLITLQNYRHLMPFLKEDSWYYKPQRDKLGHLWLSHTRGILHHDGNKYQLLNYLNQKKDPLTFCLKEDSLRNVILQGAQGYVGIIENKPPFKRTVIPAFELPNANVLSIEIAHDGTYWFAWGGLTHYDPNHKTTKYYHRTKGNLPRMGAHSLHIDPRGTLWVGASLGGVYRYDVQKDQFVRFLPDFLNRPVNFIGTLDNDHLVIGDRNNLYVFDLKNYYAKGMTRLKTFNHYNGFMGIETGADGFYQDSKGYGWVMSSTVLSRIDPRKMDLRPDSLRVFITQLDTLVMPFISTDRIWSLPDGKNTVRVAFEALGLNKPYQSEFSYRLDDNPEWSPWENEPFINLTKLTSGIHTLYVRSRTGSYDGVAPSIAQLRFSVSIPFWESPHFSKYALWGFLLLIIALTFLAWRSYRNDRRLQEQEYKARYLQVQTLQAQLNPHFTFNLLGSLKRTLLSNDRRLSEKNLDDLAVLLRRFLDASVAGNSVSEIALSDEIAFLKLYIEFEQLQYKDFEYVFEIAGNVDVENRTMAPLLIQPYVENAIKHGLHNRALERETGQLIVRLTDVNGQLVCTIEDDGIGIEASRKLQEESLGGHRSHGTKLVQERVALLNQVGYNIHISTTDRIGGGTVVTIQFG